MLVSLALVTLLVWLALVFGWHGFWRADMGLPAAVRPLDRWPSVAVLVPARNEAETIALTVASLLAQDYPGLLRVVVADDSSSDGTAHIARAAGAGNPALEVVTARPLPAGWRGKLWALQEAMGAAGTPDWYWLTDADIVHEPATLEGLVAAAEGEGLDLLSQLVRLRCEGFWEKLLVPAYVFYFALLYPFRAVANTQSGIAGAAGGSLLVRRRAIEAIGGLSAIRGALIDDCALARAVKNKGGRIWLGLSRRSRSLRRYRRLGDFWAMIKRSAYTQLGHSPLLLLATLSGLLLTYPAPPLLLVAALASGNAAAAIAAGAACGLMWWAYRPNVTHCDLASGWALTLPVAALLYAAMTLSSAVAYHTGGTNRWRGREVEADEPHL